MTISQEALYQVVGAWVVEGPQPTYHRQAQEQLRKQWPTLADALDRLAREAGAASVFECHCQCHMPLGFRLKAGQAPPPIMRPCSACAADH